MALPAIAPYPMPSAAELPPNRVAWAADPSRAALLIHDMQNHFLNAFRRDEQPVPQLLANIARLREACAAQGVPVFFSAQPGGQSLAQRGLLQDFWGGGIAAGEQPQRIVDELHPRPGETHLTKWRYSAFQRTDLLAQLRAQGRDQLIICGIYAHIGCLMTACEAFMSDIQPFFVADAVADFTPEDHQMAIAYAARRCAVVATTDAVLATLAPAPAAEALSLEGLRQAIADLLDESPAKIGDDDNLMYLGLDSIRLMTLMEQWRRAGVEISFIELAERPTLAGFWSLISAQATA
ncbi:isochorismatase family protein [Chloroflexia bacterium SDU3-3]|nr:isochorismatase family protein [Chloroflexia bacterium SDU3-3]